MSPDIDLKTISDFIVAMSALVAAVFSIWSFNSARRAEAVKPFLELRQKRYVEALHAAAILSNTREIYKAEEIQEARKRFRELYVAELSMVESPEVEGLMADLAELIDPSLAKLTPEQQTTYDLAHALRNSFIKAWGIGESKTVNRQDAKLPPE